MKTIISILILLSINLSAHSYIVSSIPVPKTYVQNLDPYECDEDCLEDFIEEGMIFSFLAHASSEELDSDEHDEIRKNSILALNLGLSEENNKLKIALLLPYKKIGRYAASTTNAAFAYLVTRTYSFELKTYNIVTENEEDIDNALSQIKNDGYNYIIAPLTLEGANTLIELEPNEDIYFPTINKKDLNSTLENVYFGGIDYKAQSDVLLKEAVSPLVIFYDKSKLGSQLCEYEEEQFKSINQKTDLNISSELALNEQDVEESDINSTLDNNISVHKYSIPKRVTNIEEQLLYNENIKQGSMFINTPIVKSSMIMSQLRMYDVNATNILSTQINYDPLVLSLTQYEDRSNMIIANSITNNISIFIETNSLLGNDIVYDWINYTTTVGIDYFFNKITSEDKQYNIEMIENQMQYPIELIKPSETRFIKYVSRNEETLY